MSAQPRLDQPAFALTPGYVRSRDPRSLLGPRTLAVYGFGAAAPAQLDDPRYLRVPLQPLEAEGADTYEVWTCNEAVEPWRDGPIGGGRSTSLCFGALQIHEGNAGPAASAEQAYRLLAGHRQRAAHPHLLRLWNYLDAIVEGEGDSERYRQFCVGRAEALDIPDAALPAATAIGHREGTRLLQVYWLASTRPGLPVENPRQVPAYRYPRSYGPRSPSFARAMRADPDDALPLLLSGTAAVVGHASLHHDSVVGQLRETFDNFDSLLGAARAADARIEPAFGAHSLLKVYLRDAAALAELQAALSRLLPSEVPRLILQGDICRRELAVEIDGFHG